MKIKIQMKANIKVMIIAYGKRLLNNNKLLRKKGKSKVIHKKKQEQQAQGQEQIGEEQIDMDFDEEENLKIIEKKKEKSLNLDEKRLKKT